MQKTLNRARKATRIVLSVFLVGCLLPISAIAQDVTTAPTQPSSSGPRDGQHDFDFEFGAWKSHISRRLHPLTGSTTWVQMDATVVVRKVWDGRASLMELVSDSPASHLEELDLRLYNPQSHQWSRNFASSSDGTMEPPMFGEFKNGRGEFIGSDTLNGRAILVRHVFSEITPDSHHFEQSFSDDGGNTWEPNFVATLMREEGTTSGAEILSLPASEVQDGAHDFDFNFGVWKIHIQRLLHPLTGSRSWVGYDGTSVVSKVWGGRANLFEIEATGPAGHIEGVELRLFNPQSHQWSLNWANSRDGVMTTPMVGTFVHGQGQFHDQEEFQGRIIMTRNGFSDITPDSIRFEQAFSEDFGKTWETNWIMSFNR
jgi:hypothetical protein